VSNPEALFDITGPIARLTFNRPATRNALTWAMYDALVSACAAADATPDIRALVIRGAGDAFAAGTDIRQFVGYMPEYDCLPPDTSATDFVTHMARMSGLPKAPARERTAEVLRHVGLYEER
jgi:enoyl-CoA hydratase/carnithine racemase